ncbi:MAG: hypothetical protein OH316_02265 [Candidatus Parvarchaeota archaeon]|nr:hypothetical protein [Candidatus Parvarchaeota archaeon]MCW1301935.1 hypothetical protein [Candidatus Parvarchaeota archaeon]
MMVYNRYSALILVLVVALMLSFSLSHAIQAPPVSGTSAGGLFSSLSLVSYSGSTLFGIPWSIVMSIILSVLIAFIVYGALKETHMSNGAGVIGALFGAILLVILYLNPKYLILLTSIGFISAFIILVLAILAFARKKLSTPGKVVGIILAVILLYILFDLNPVVGNYIDNVLGFNISSLMLPILAYMFVFIILYILYALTYKRAKSALSKSLSALFIIAVAAALLIPGFLHFIALSALILGLVLLALLLLAVFLKLWHGRERIERIPRRPSKAQKGNKTFVTPAASLKNPNPKLYLGAPEKHLALPPPSGNKSSSSSSSGYLEYYKGLGSNKEKSAFVKEMFEKAKSGDKKAQEFIDEIK